MSHLCNFPITEARLCRQPVADPQQQHCSQHRMVGNAGLVKQVITTAVVGCQMVQIKGGVWRCRIHRGSTWTTALALGAMRPCRLPLSPRDRKQLATAPSLDRTTAYMLACDPTRYVRRELAFNKKLSPDLLRLLAAHRTELVDPYIAIHRKCPPDVLLRLLDGAMPARLWAIGNRNMPADALARLAQSADETTRGAVAGNSSAPQESLRMLAHDPAESVRAEVAKNRCSDRGLLLELTRDEEHTVRTRAQQSLNWLDAMERRQRGTQR